MTIYILKGYPASQNKMLIICMKWIKFKALTMKK